MVYQLKLTMIKTIFPDAFLARFVSITRDEHHIFYILSSANKWQDSGGELQAQNISKVYVPSRTVKSFVHELLSCLESIEIETEKRRVRE